MRLAKALLPILAVVVLSGTAVQAEQIDNPEYVNWKQFKVGAMVKQEMVTVAAGNETKTIMTITLKELTAEKAVISTASSMVMGGNKFDMPAQDRTIPAKVDKPPEMPKPENPPKVEEGEETLTIGGKEVKCKWMKTTMKMGENTTVSKVWTSASMPGSTVKMETTMEGQMSSKTNLIVTEFKTE